MTTQQKIWCFCSRLVISAVIISGLDSCGALKPVTQNDLLQPLNSLDIKKFEGDYEIISADTSYPTLARALTFTNKKALVNFNRLDQLHNKNVKLNIQAIDERHMKISVYSEGKIIKTKKLTGTVSENYFHFKYTKISPVPPFYLLLSLLKKQDNRIGLTKNGDLLLDSYEGGVLLLIVAPTFGGSAGSYNLVFKRKKSNN